jgi:DNA polymerase-1
MIDIQHEMKEKKMKSRMLMQVHDELVFEVHLDEVDAMKALVESGMKNAMKLEVPVVVEMNTGRNWLEAH